ncbi:hypothetical protein T4B_3164 [Trichinella pseudospiralis]|uniref:Uncharacterized protein n=1 Tax=Trichinella pseudospiralis TaxID=6337 RepID=A0A0V1GU79_TRIPS|nr:hypothetical protein T4B_3164 [Trichinella pseudospiralis]
MTFPTCNAVKLTEGFYCFLAIPDIRPRLSLAFYAADYAFETEQQGECSICTMFKKVFENGLLQMPIKKDLQILRFNDSALLHNNQDKDTLLQDTVINADNALFPAEKNLLRTY